MAMPTQQELEQALATAAKMRAAGKDPDHMAKSLLNLNERLQLLEKVLHYSKLYLHSGEGAQEHALLLKAIEAAEQATASSDQTDFGLE